MTSLRVHEQVMYGPELTGRGLVLQSSFPAIERHLPSGMRPASEAAHDMREMAAGLVAEIAGLMSLWAKARSVPRLLHGFLLPRLRDTPVYAGGCGC